MSLSSATESFSNTKIKTPDSSERCEISSSNIFTECAINTVKKIIDLNLNSDASVKLNYNESQDLDRKIKNCLLDYEMLLTRLKHQELIEVKQNTENLFSKAELNFLTKQRLRKELNSSIEINLIRLNNNQKRKVEIDTFNSAKSLAEKVVKIKSSIENLHNNSCKNFTKLQEKFNLNFNKYKLIVNQLPKSFLKKLDVKIKQIVLRSNLTSQVSDQTISDLKYPIEIRLLKLRMQKAEEKRVLCAVSLYNAAENNKLENALIEFWEAHSEIEKVKRELIEKGYPGTELSGSIDPIVQLLESQSADRVKKDVLFEYCLRLVPEAGSIYANMQRELEMRLSEFENNGAGPVVLENSINIDKIQKIKTNLQKIAAGRNHCDKLRILGNINAIYCLFSRTLSAIKSICKSKKFIATVVIGTLGGIAICHSK